MENKAKLLFYLESYLGDSKPTSKENRAFSCPFCGHAKKKLEVDLDSYFYNCWTCDPPTKGKNVLSLFYKLGATSREVERIKLILDSSKIDKWLDGEQREEVEIEYTIILPDEYKPLYEGNLDWIGHRAYKYLNNRGISDGIIKAFKIGYASKGRYFNRVIMPIFDKAGKVVYFVTRSLDEHPEIKYLDPKHKHGHLIKRSIVPMEFFLDTSQPINLVEGLFDFYNTPNSIPCLGTNVLPGVLDFILTQEKPINICFDGDAINKVARLAKRIRSFGKDVSYTPLPTEQDPAELGYHNMKLLINNSVPINDLELLKLKLYG